MSFECVVVPSAHGAARVTELVSPRGSSARRAGRAAAASVPARAADFFQNLRNLQSPPENNTPQTRRMSSRAGTSAAGAARRGKEPASERRTTGGGNRDDDEEDDEKEDQEDQEEQEQEEEEGAMGGGHVSLGSVLLCILVAVAVALGTSVRGLTVHRAGGGGGGRA